MAKSLEETFWSKVTRQGTDECWLWIGHTNTKRFPYGKFGFKGKYFLAHRVSWEIHNNKKIPNGLLACHKCDNPRCVNPSHIFIGTYSDNTRDAVVKKRQYIPDNTKTHCKYGHPLIHGNLFYSGNQRRCRSCHQKRLIKSNHKRRCGETCNNPNHVFN